MWMPGHELFHRPAIMNSCEKNHSAQLGLSSRVPKNEVQSILIYLIFPINWNEDSVGPQNSPCTIVAEQKQDNRNGEQHLRNGTLTGLKMIWPLKEIVFF